MARASTPAKPPATRKGTSVATNDLQAQIAARIAAEIDKQKEKVGNASGNKIKVGKKGFELPDGNTRNEIEVVIVDFVSVNSYFDRPYDPDTPAPPACFSISIVPKGMLPSENSPATQCDNCDQCPQNQFGSALVGKGKACKNNRRLAVMPENADDKTEPWLLDVAPTSIKSFDSLIRTLTNGGMMPFQIVAKVSLDDSVDYPKLEFEALDALELERQAFFMDARDKAAELLMAEPDVSQYEAPKPKGARARK